MKIGQPYWWDGQKAGPKLAAEPPSKCDLLIVGAGYTGLTAAITAAQAGADVCVVDAAHPGFGASSRNGGMCGAHPRLSLAATAKKFGPETAKGIFDEASSAFDYFKTLLKTHKIECDYQQTGRIQLAWTKADFKAQRAMAEEMNTQTAFPVELLSRDDVKAHIDSPHYFGALYYKDHGALQPRKFSDGLLRAAISVGAKVVPNTAVRTISKGPKGFAALTPNGEIRAERVLLATNGYRQGGGALHWMSRRIFPLPSYLIATAPLPQDLIKKLAPAGRMMVETHPRHSYWRISPDGTRIIFGGRAAIRQMNLQQAAARLKRTMVQIWPALEHTPLSHVWKGNTGYTFRAAPQVGQVGGVNFAGGYCGGGVVLAPYLGMKAAYQILGDDRGQTAYSDTTLATRPFYLGEARPLFLEIADRWFTYAVDPKENARAARDRM